MDEVLSLYETLDMFMVLVVGLLSALIGKKIILLFRTPYKSISIFPSPAGMSLTKHSLGRNNDVIYKLFPPSVIPAGDGNIEKLFYGEVSLRIADLDSLTFLKRSIKTSSNLHLNIFWFFLIE
jgi:hypothetical protein